VVAGNVNLRNLENGNKGRMLSVLIPSRNEFLLAKTIESIFQAAQDEIEVLAVLDGCWDIPQINDDPRLTLIYHKEPIGQRAAVNKMAKLAKGKYILKTDGHSMFEKGFDIKLANDCEYDWTVIPRMYNLHAFDWVCSSGHRFYQDKANPNKVNNCSECSKRLKIEMVWKIRKHKRTDFMYINSDLKVKYWNSYNKRPEAKGKIVDVMNGIGACWFQHRDRFLELGGLDEKHGFWGQVGVEIACKSWLSGGRQVVNKNTWFAHVFRTTGEYSFPYKNPGSHQRMAEKYSRDLWLNNKWPLQKRDFKWLIDKFSPVPTWNSQLKAKPSMSSDEGFCTPEEKLNGDYFLDTMPVDDIWKNRIKHTQHQKTREWLERYTKRHPNMDKKTRLIASSDKAAENFFASFPVFVRMVLDNKQFRIEDTDYYKYLKAHLHPHDLMNGFTEKGKKRLRYKCRDAIRLIKDIKENGMKNPLDMWLEKENRILRKGCRRMVILKELGVYKADVRIWKNEEIFFKNQTGHIPKKWRKKFGR